MSTFLCPRQPSEFVFRAHFLSLPCSLFFVVCSSLCPSSLVRFILRKLQILISIQYISCKDILNKYIYYI